MKIGDLVCSMYDELFSKIPLIVLEIRPSSDIYSDFAVVMSPTGKRVCRVRDLRVVNESR